MQFLYETHLHTAESSACAGSTAAEQVRAYKARGYTGIIVTDHFLNGNSSCPPGFPWREKILHFSRGYEAAKREGEKRGLDVFFGLEYSIYGSDFLIYGLDAEFLQSSLAFADLPIKECGSVVRRRGGYIAQAHPYQSWSLSIDSRPAHPSLLDGVEVFNLSKQPEANRKALEFARANNLPIQAGSDSHSAGNEFASGIILQKKAESVFDIIDAIKANEIELIVPKGSYYD